MTTITMRRCTDIADARYGRLLPGTARFHRHRPAVDWSDSVALTFHSWAQAQRALAALRGGDPTLWNERARGA